VEGGRQVEKKGENRGGCLQWVVRRDDMERDEMNPLEAKRRKKE